MSESKQERLVVIADTHMAAGTHDPFTADDELAAFLDMLAADAPDTRLLVLGDLLDFSRVEEPEGDLARLDTRAPAALDKLDLIAHRHAAVFDRLRQLLAVGARVEVVPGNHDLELLLPPVWDAFSQLVAGGRADSLSLRSWISYTPGGVYAEHGHQHHDVNRVPDLLLLRDRDAVPVPAGTALGEFGLARRSGRTVPAAAGLAGGLWRAAMHRRMDHASHERAIAEEARAVGLEPGVLATIHGLDPDGLVRAAGRTAVRLATERLRRRPSLPYMQSAAGDVHRVLDDHRVSVPFYVTGHTHVPADIPLDASARYLNPGTWSTLRPRGAQPGYAYVEIVAGSARLRTWSG